LPVNAYPEAFKIYNCLIKLPHDAPPVVEFNEEIHWLAKAKPGGIDGFTPGDPVYLDQLDRIETVEAPEVGGKRVAFLYLFWAGQSYRLIFDFSPNHAKGEPPAKGEGDWDLGKHIGASLQAVITEHAVRLHDSVQQLLTRIGLWAAPALLPYPLTKIATLVRDGNTEAARKLLVNHCRPEFLKNTAKKWQSQPEFGARWKLVESALDAHAAGQYPLTIHALLPHLEGIITDWIHTKTADVPWKQESKTKKFREVIAAGPPNTYTYQRVVGSVIDFILSGPVLGTFKGWFDSIDDSFANRNAVGHGKYDDALFSEENSVKLILLLDTVYHIISGQGGSMGKEAATV
jgi:hypothetical protein